jgi:hypothetical protein
MEELIPNLSDVFASHRVVFMASEPNARQSRYSIVLYSGRQSAKLSNLISSVVSNVRQRLGL